MRDLKAHKPSKANGNRRKRKRQPPDWKKIFHRLLRGAILTGSVALLLNGGYLLGRLAFRSDAFKVTEVRLETEVARVAEREVLAQAGIEPGDNIFALDLDAIGRKLEENPWIARAQVRRVFPRQVEIRVEERQPLAVINLGYLYYVDDGGDVFKLLEPTDRLDFPVITGIDRQFMLENPAEARRLVQDAVTVLKALQGREVFSRADVSELNVGRAEGVDLFTYVGGVPIRLGFGHFADKLDRLEQIYAELKPRLSVLKYIDLNVVDRVIVKVDSRYARVNG